MDEGEVLIENNEFVDNFAGDYGGAIYINNYQNSHVVGNYFLGNWAEYGGGAIFVSLTDPDSTSVTIEANIFSGGTASYGSAVSVSNSEILFTNNIVKDTLGVSALDLSSSGPPSIISNNYIIRPAQNGENLRCNRGRARPRQPNSSIGPRNKAVAIAGNTWYQGEKGKGSVTDPFRAAPE